MSLPAVSVAKRKNEAHGMSNTRAYRIWAGMHARCNCPSARSYENYGGRGITVCERWNSFEAFLADMGQPGDGLSIDRVDGSKGYEPGNCVWATRTQQNRNQADLHFLTLDGVTYCVSEWAERIGANYDVLRARLKRGWSVEKTLRTPVRPHKQYERRTA